MLQTRFLPEFLNRIDEIIDLPSARARRNPQDRRSAGRRGCESSSTQQGTHVGRHRDARATRSPHEGYDPTYGARPLKRVIQQRIQNPLAVELLRGDFREGDSIQVDHRDGQFTFAHT